MSEFGIKRQPLAYQLNLAIHNEGDGPPIGQLLVFQNHPRIIAGRLDLWLVERRPHDIVESMGNAENPCVLVVMQFYIISALR